MLSEYFYHISIVAGSLNRVFFWLYSFFGVMNYSNILWDNIFKLEVRTEWLYYVVSYFSSECFFVVLRIVFRINSWFYFVGTLSSPVCLYQSISVWFYSDELFKSPTKEVLKRVFCRRNWLRCLTVFTYILYTYRCRCVLNIDG